MAFVQHMVASLDDLGRMAVVLPNGCFFRGGAEHLVRRDLVDGDLVEAVIQLPTDMFFGATIPACWLIVNRAKRASRRDIVVFIDASQLFERIDTKNVLRDDDIHRIVAAFRADDAEEGFCASATLEEIAAHRYTLSPRRYIGGSAHHEVIPSLPEAMAAYRDRREQRQRAEGRLLALLETLGEA
jgi:type I restriction enzyme M protein